MGVQNFLNQTYQGVGGGLCPGTFQKKMKKGCVGNKWGWRYAMLMLMGGVEEGSQGDPKLPPRSSTLPIIKCYVSFLACSKISSGWGILFNWVLSRYTLIHY
jgi:hypothetical protein